MNHNTLRSTPLDYEGKLRMSQRSKNILAGTALALTLFGVAKGVEAHREQNRVEFSDETISYTVLEGQTLWTIAGELYPDVDRQEAVHHLAEANKDEFADGDLDAHAVLQVPKDAKQ